MLGFPGGSDGKASAYDEGDAGSILGREDPLEKEVAPHSSTCLENPMDGGAWRATVGGVAESDTAERLRLRFASPGCSLG